MRSANSGTYRHEVLLDWYDTANFFTAVFSQLQFWYLYLLVSVQPKRDLHSQMTYMLPFLSDVVDTPIVETNYHLRDVDQNNAVRIPVQLYQL